jgi:hypothetical protein
MILGLLVFLGTPPDEFFSSLDKLLPSNVTLRDSPLSFVVKDWESLVFKDWGALSILP